MKPLRLLIFVVFLAIGCGVFAQGVPPLINYQGRLTDQTGVPLATGIYGIQFRLWDSATATNGGDLIWAQQQTLAVQTNGVFNVILGSPGGSSIPGTTPAVNNLAYAFGSSNVFLGVTITISNGVAITSPSEILPRQEILTVPFAVSAQFSYSSSRLKPSNASTNMVVFVSTNGNVGIGNLNPASLLDVSGIIRANSFVGEGSGLTNLTVQIPSNLSLGTFSANTTYQNTTGFKIMVVWYGSSNQSGGWGFINQIGLIGVTSPSTEVAVVSFTVPGNPFITQSASFIVPNGYYWEVTNQAGVGGSTVGNILRIEAWEIQ